MAVTWIERNPKWLKVLASPHPAWNSLLVILLIAGLQNFASWNWASPLWFVVGVIGWTFFEYGMHRWIYHGTYKNKSVREFIESFHIYHHRNIKDERVLTAGVLMIVPLAAISLMPFYFLFELLSSTGFFPYAIGFIGAYGFYEWVHFLIHKLPNPQGYLKWISRYHMHHHDRRWDRCFGNTSSLWDHLLGTYSAPTGPDRTQPNELGSTKHKPKLQSHRGSGRGVELQI